MADFDFLDSLGISDSELDQPQTAYEKLIKSIGEQLAEEFKEFYKTKGWDNGSLFQSTIGFPTGAFSFEIRADQHFKYVDEGVNPVGNKKFPSPYNFKNPFVSKNHAVALKEWKGYSLKRAYASAYVTKNKYGIEPRNIIDNVITDETLERIGNDLASVTGLIFDVKWNKSTEKWQ